MEILRPHTADGEALESPVVHVPSELGKLALHWLNCRIRTFSNNEQFNHVEYTHDDGQVVGFQDEELMDVLHEHQFPALDLPYVDSATFNWLANHLAGNIDTELEGFEP